MVVSGSVGKNVKKKLRQEIATKKTYTTNIVVPSCKSNSIHQFFEIRLQTNWHLSNSGAPSSSYPVKSLLSTLNVKRILSDFQLLPHRFLVESKQIPEDRKLTWTWLKVIPLGVYPICRHTPVILPQASLCSGFALSFVIAGLPLGILVLGREPPRAEGCRIFLAPKQGDLFLVLGKIKVQSWPKTAIHGLIMILYIYIYNIIFCNLSYRNYMEL